MSWSSFTKAVYCHTVVESTRRKTLHEALTALGVFPKKHVGGNIQNHLRIIEELSKNQFHDVRDEDPCKTLHRLHGEGMLVNENVLLRAVISCLSFLDINYGSQIHSLALRIGLLFDACVGSSMVNLYTKCRMMEDAQCLFDEMPIRGTVSWCTIISGYIRECNGSMCWKLYQDMRNSTLELPNEFTFTSFIGVCTKIGSLSLGRSIHCQIIRMGLNSNTYIGNCLLSMYFKCGDIKDACFLFYELPLKDLISWNTMMMGFSEHGHATETIRVLKEMKMDNIMPDHISFLSILSACRHTCMVKQCWVYFGSMVKHGVRPDHTHYSCMVDLLGRAGFIEEARDLVMKMADSPNSIIWGSLLSSSRLHGKFLFAIEAAENKLLLEPHCVSTRIQLANLYSSAGFWGEAAKMRSVVKEKGMKNCIGFSWIEIQSVVYSFKAGDGSNCQMKEMTSILYSLLLHMRRLEKSSNIQTVGCDDFFTGVEEYA